MALSLVLMYGLVGLMFCLALAGAGVVQVMHEFRRPGPLFHEQYYAGHHRMQAVP